MSISRIWTRSSGNRLPGTPILRDAGSGPVETEKSCLNEPSGMRPPRSMPGERKDVSLCSFPYAGTIRIRFEGFAALGGVSAPCRGTPWKQNDCWAGAVPRQAAQNTPGALAGLVPAIHDLFDCLEPNFRGCAGQARARRIRWAGLRQARGGFSCGDSGAHGDGFGAQQSRHLVRKSRINSSWSSL